MNDKESKISLEEYNQKYSKKKSHLLKISEKELNEFDKKYKTNKYLLKDRKWTKIGKEYYEVPVKTKNVFKWFIRLSTKGKIITSLIAGSAVAVSVAVPVVYFNTDHYSNFSTTVRKVTMPEFGNIDFDATMNDFTNHGFDYGDLIDLKIYDVNGQDYTFPNLPIVTNYNEAGPYAMCLCNYEGLSDRLDLSFAMHPLKNNPDILVGKKVDIKMKKKRGFQKTRELIKCPAKLTYEQVNRNNAYYANFRNVCQTGEMPFKNNILFRGSSPFNYEANGNDRYYIADKLVGHYGINYEISLSCNMKKVDKYMENLSDDYSTKILYKTSKNCTDPTKIDDRYAFTTYDLAGDYFTFDSSISLDEEETRENLPGGNLIHKIFNRMFYVFKYFNDGLTPNQPIFYFHCNEGKDRTGFFGVLLEALCGCSLNDIIADYMLTFQHYYNITLANNPDKYNALAEQTVYRYIYSLCIDKPTEELYKIDWNGDFDVKKEVENKLNGSPEALIGYASKYIKSLCRYEETIAPITWESKIDDYIIRNLKKSVV